MAKKKKLRLKTRVKRLGRQSLIMILTVGLTVLFSAYIGLLLVLKGPSPTLSNLVVSTFWETRRGKAVVNFFFTDEEREAILARNNADNFSTDASLSDNDYSDFNIPEEEKDDLEIVEVSGGTWKGKLMIVRDPSRISLGCNTVMPDPEAGYSVLDYVESEGALAGINAGGFDDPGGTGDGSIPYKIVIKDSQLVAGSLSDYDCVIGFNTADHLIVGNMTGQNALDWGLRDAVTFGPVLVFNGSAVPVTGNGGGLNPRTVIGQTADGSVLLLVIDGRQPNSIGATYEDCINLMLKYGAIVAANLDGGSSSVMVYNDEIINSVVSMRGDRSVPTAWLVK